MMVGEKKIDIEYSDDPTRIDDAVDFDTKQAICAICFDDIRQPLLNGIWYHWSFGKDVKDHEPVPASPLFLLFWINSKPKKRYYSGNTEHKKCSTHEKYWNKLLEFKPLNEGFHHDHFYTSDYRSLCGMFMDVTKRHFHENSNAEFPKEDFWKCQRCLNRLEKLGMIKKIPVGEYVHGHYKLKWIKKKIPKKVGNKK